MYVNPQTSVVRLECLPHRRQATTRLEEVAVERAGAVRRKSSRPCQLPRLLGRPLEEVRSLAVELPRADEVEVSEREPVLRLGDEGRDRGRDGPADVEGRGDHQAGGGFETGDRLEDTTRRRVAGIR